MADTPTAAPKAKKHRSPAYPGITLQQAIKRATEFYEKEHRNSASFKAAVSHWGYSEKSSGALVTVAALKSFGLLDEIDGGSGRTFQVSPLGLKIIADKRPESNERDAAIREAALKPKIHAEIWRKYNGRVPSDAELQYRMENDWHFNLNVIGAFIKEFRDTISFAKVTESDKVGEVSEEDEPEIEGAEVEVGGNQPKPLPHPLLRFTRSQLQQPAGGPVMRDDTYSLDDGRQVIISWPHPLPSTEMEDIRGWMKMVERKIARSSDEKPLTPEEAFGKPTE